MSQFGLTVSRIKIMCADEARLYCDVNFKWHMPICAEICRAEKIYIILYTIFICNIYHFSGPSPSALPEKNHSTRTYTNNATLRFGFFLITRSVTVPRFGFFQDSRIKFNNFVMLLFRYKFCNDDTMDSLVRMFGDMSWNTKQIPINWQYTIHERRRLQ